MSVPARRDDLDRWVAQELISGAQRDAILAWERQRAEVAHAEHADEGPGRFMSAISTVGAAIAIAAAFGIVTLFIEDWTSGQAMVVALAGALVAIAAAWQLVRNGWGAPAGVFAIFGIALIPLALGLGVDAAGWWPEDGPRTDPNKLDQERQQIVGYLLLAAIVPGMLATRLGLRQPWLLLPAALWFGVSLQGVPLFENSLVVVAQVLAGAAVALLAAFGWGTAGETHSSGWWLQLGGLVLAGVGIAVSTGEDQMVFPLLGVLAAGAIFVTGVVSRRMAWTVAGALAALPPGIRLVFEYLGGVGGMLIVALLGLAIAFVPLLLWRRSHGQLPSAT